MQITFFKPFKRDERVCLHARTGSVLLSPFRALLFRNVQVSLEMLLDMEGFAKALSRPAPLLGLPSSPPVFFSPLPFNAELLQLAKERPQTDAAVARRLVTRALGLQRKLQQCFGQEVQDPENSSLPE